MNNLENRLIDGNIRFLQKIYKGMEDLNTDNEKSTPPILILTCMDPRIDVHRIFQLNLGDAFVLKNAGNTYTTDVLRSLLVAIIEYGVKHILVLGHLDCGMSKIKLIEFKKKIKFSLSLKELKDFFKPFNDEIQHIKKQINKLKALPQIPSNVEILGMIYDPMTGIVFEKSYIENYDTMKEFAKDYISLVEIKDQERSKKVKDQNFKPQIIQKTILLDKESINEQKNAAFHLEDKVLNINLKQEIPEEKKTLSEEIDNKGEFKIEIPRIMRPQIRFPKIRVHIPFLKKNNPNT
ncbi:MAG: beta-class carbonic anhydrase [Promethearchaeota archaeon]